MMASNHGNPGPDLEYVIKSSKMRMMAVGGAGYIVVDWNLNKTLTVWESKKLALAQELPMARTKSPSGRELQSTLRASAKFDTVAGYRCEELELVQQGHTVGACAVKGLRWLGAEGPSTVSWFNTPEVSYFPLRIVEFDSTGAEIKRLEAKTIERLAVDDAVFTVPPDYRYAGNADRVDDQGAMLEGRPQH